MAESTAIAPQEIRNDGILLNALTGAGDPEYDRGMHTTVGVRTRLDKTQLEELACNWICRNIVNAYPREATRRWLEMTLGADADQEILGEFDNYQTRLKIANKFKQAQQWANLYRGAALVIVAEDGLDFKEPLKRDRIRTIRKLELLDCHKIQPELGLGADPYDPEFYRLALDRTRHKALEEAGTLIHHTRVIRFDGVELPPDAMLYTQPVGWGASLLELVFEAFVDYESVHRSVADMTASFNVFKMAMKDLDSTIKAGGKVNEDYLKARFRSMQKMMSTMRGIAVDADKESVDFISRNFAGIADVIDRFTSRLVGASDLPFTVLFGRGPSGLAAQGTGDAEDTVWAKKVSQFQETEFRPKFRYIAELIWLAKDSPTKGKLPEDWDFKFRSLVEETEKSKMEARQAAATTYNTYVQMGSLLPEEVRNSQFGGSEYSFEIKLDEELWQQKQEQDQGGGGFGDFGGYGDPAALGGDPTAEALPPADAGVAQLEPAALQQDSWRLDGENEFTDESLHQQALREARSKFNVFPSAYASLWLSKRYRSLFKQKHGSVKEAFRVKQDTHLDDTREWLEEDWVRIGSDGQIMGACGDRSSREGKPRCLPRKRAEAMSVAERKAIVAKKRREDPDKDRKGKALMVSTKVGER